jgi:endonuclease/exonuclease/phosphatase (EEP) superfamily protein YafD
LLHLALFQRGVSVHIVSLLAWTLSLLLIAVTLLPLINSPRWWIRVWDYPRLQVAAALALMLLAQGVVFGSEERGFGLTHSALALATACAFGWQAFSIWPYTRAHKLQSLPAAGNAGDDAISVMVANVLQSNRNASGLLRILTETRPDILIAVETDRWWDSQLEVLTERYPYRVRIPQENTYGMHVFSSLELRDVCIRELVTKEIPSVRASVRLKSGRWIDLYAVHPEPPVPSQDSEERDAELLLVAREVKERARPALVAGDLNDVAWSHTTRLFQRMSGLLDPRVGRGIFATFHTGHWLVRWPLDHLFHDRRFRLRDIVVLDSYGSDHFPIFASLVFDPEAEKEAPRPRPKPGDREEAREKIVEGTTAGTQEA